MQPCNREDLRSSAIYVHLSVKISDLRLFLASRCAGIMSALPVRVPGADRVLRSQGSAALPVEPQGERTALERDEDNELAAQVHDALLTLT